MNPPPHYQNPINRREFLAKAGGGFGALALTQILSQNLFAEVSSSPMLSKLPHHVPTAKSVIFVFLQGGPSHIDLFDPKPKLQELAGQQVPPSFKPVITAMGEFYSPLLPSKRVFKQHGK